MKTSLFVTFTAFILLFSSLSYAQNAAVAVGGDVGKPFTIKAETYTEFKPITVKVKSMDGREHEYSGIKLYDILTKAEAIPNNQLSGKSLIKFVLVSAADGYQIVVALPEIDPAFTDETIILANKMDGEDLAANLGPFRLIILKDKKPARSAMRVVSIDVLTAKKL